MRTKIVFSLAAGALVLLGACGSTAKSTTADTTGSTPSSASAAPTDTTPSAAAPASGAPTDSTPTSGANGAAIGAAMQAWTACLSQNGVTIPSVAAGNGTGSFPRRSTPESGAPTNSDGSRPARGTGAGGGFGGGLQTINSILQEPANSAAAAACKSLQPTFGQGGAGNAANRQAFNAYLSCLASNGVTVPTVDSTPTSGSQPAAGRPQVNQNDPNFAAADAKCRVLLPQTNGSTAPAAGAATATTSA